MPDLLVRRTMLGLIRDLVATAAVAWLAATAASAQDWSPRMAPELSPNIGWLNTDRPLRLSDELKGHVVLLDFWTYCCINCMHILPDLEYLENKYADDPFVVLGVHSAKFTNESTRESIRQAIQRYDIHHPVVIDRDMEIWRAYGVRSWPTFVLIGADGRVVGATSGEGLRDTLDGAIARALADGRARGDLADRRVQITHEAMVPAASGLRFPGKVASWRGTDGSGYLFVSDSSNDRVIVASLPDDHGVARVVRSVGSGNRGLADGDEAVARFHDPQGLAFDPASRTLYVADTNNHAIRAVHLDSWTVETLVGSGAQSHDRKGGMSGREQGLNSPWGLALSRDGKTLFVTMAGSHQLWTVDLRTRVASRLAGSGVENITDGAADRAALAQPSGATLSSDGGTLYFADSEASAVRRFDRKSKRVSTIIGTGLFEFGDVDGVYPRARLQHPLGVALWPLARGAAPDADAHDLLFVADTYNHKIKIIDPTQRSVRTFSGSELATKTQPEALTLDEPGGVWFAADTSAPPVNGQSAGTLYIADTNHNRIVGVDIATGDWREVAFDGLVVQTPTDEAWDENLAIRASIGINTNQPWKLSLDVHLPGNRKINPEAALSVRVLTESPDGGSRVAAQRTMRASVFPVSIDLAPGLVKPGESLFVEAFFASCAKDHSVCLPEETRWRVTVNEGTSSEATLVADLAAPIQSGVGKPGSR